MPEIAECYSIAERLPKNFIIEKIESSLNIGDIFPKKNDIVKLKLVKVLEPFAYGKSIWFPLLKNNIPGYLVSQLGMTGTWFFDSKNNTRDRKHNHLIFRFKDHLLIYNDPRRFGSLNVYWGSDFNSLKLEIIKKRKWGIDPLVSSGREIEQIISLTWSKSEKSIKSIMLNQNVIFGIGNYLASEILYHAKVNPFKLAAQLSPKEFKEIAQSMVIVMRKAKAAGGFSFAGGYILPDGTYGNYYKKALVYLKENCRVCENKINKIPIDGRVTYFCPHCQKK